MAKRRVKKAAAVKPAAPKPEAPIALAAEPEELAPEIDPAVEARIARAAQITALFPDAGFEGDVEDPDNLDAVIIAAFEVGRRKMLRGV